MAEQDIQDEMEVKFHFVLPGQEWGRFKGGDVVELTAGQAYGWEGVKVSKGYVTEKGAQNAAERDATVADAPKPRKVDAEAIDVLVKATIDAGEKAEKAEIASQKGAKEVTNVK